MHIMWGNIRSAGRSGVLQTLGGRGARADRTINVTTYARRMNMCSCAVRAVREFAQLDGVIAACAPMVSSAITVAASNSLGALHAVHEFAQLDGVLAGAPRQQRRLVHHVCQLRSGEPCAEEEWRFVTLVATHDQAASGALPRSPRRPPPRLEACARRGAYSHVSYDEELKEAWGLACPVKGFRV